MTTEPRKDGTPEERRAYRLTRLPILAKEELAARDRRIAELERQLKKATTGNPRPGAPTCVDYLGSLDGMPVPTDRVRFLADEVRRNGIQVYVDRGMLLIHADDGFLEIRPATANEAYVRARRFADDDA